MNERRFVLRNEFIRQKMTVKAELDFEQRQEAERLIEAAQEDDVLRALIYELIDLRELAEIWEPKHCDKCKELLPDAAYRCPAGDECPHKKQ